MFRYPFIAEVNAEETAEADDAGDVENDAENNAENDENTEKAPAEDVVDPQDVLRKQCSGTRKIAGLWDTLQECTERVNSKTKTEETCEQELFDYVGAMDHCVAKTLFSHLK